MTKKPKSTKNLAKNVITPKLKRIDIPTTAKVEITRANVEINNYISGVAAGLGIKGKWGIDMKAMQFVVEETNDKET